MLALNTNTTSEYPSDSIDPRKKSYDWLLSYVKAAHAEGRSYMPALQGTLYYQRLEEIRAYALGKQPINKYKQRLPADQPNNQAPANLNWEVVPVICRFREIIISRLLQRRYDITCYAVDPLAQSAEDEIFNQMKVKVMMREALQKAGSPLANSPVLKQQQGEPSDMEELAMQQEFGYKDAMCMEAEEGIQLIHQQNMFDEKRKRAIENLVDYGLGGYTQDINENGKVIEDDVPTKNLLLSYCEKNDFSDLCHWGIYKEVNLVDLAPWFSNEQMDEIQKNVAGKNNNPNPTNVFRRNWAKYKVCVLKFKLATYNDYVHKKEVDSTGNDRFMPTEYENLKFIKGSTTKDTQTPKYISTTKKVVYKLCWICDTNMMFDWGESENQIRKPSSWWDTNLDIQLYAWNFDNMLFTGITERLIPIADAYQQGWMKLQNLKAKLIPYLIDIDLNAVDSVVFGGGGQKMTKAEIMDFIFSNFIVLSRKTDLINQNPNYKTVQIQSTGMLDAFVQIYQDLQNCMSMLYDITGLNQITAAATPNPKTLVPGYENANISTDNALGLIAIADRNLILREADNVFCKIQIAVKLGKVEGYVKPLGSETVKFLSINPDLSLVEMGLFIEDAPTDDQRNLFYQELFQDQQSGLIEPQDRVKLMGFRNLKQAYRYLAYIVKKRKEEMRQFELQKIQQQNQGATQAGLEVEKARRETAIILHQLKMEEINIEKEWDWRIEYMKKSSDQIEGQNQASAKVISAQLAAESGIQKQQIAAEASKAKASAAG